MMTFWTLLACVADGAIVGAVIGGLLGYRSRAWSALAHERERVRQRYIVLLDRGGNLPLSLSEQQEIQRLSQRWCELGLPQTPLGAPFPERLRHPKLNVCHSSSPIQDFKNERNISIFGATLPGTGG
jgi:hypothetical protein